MNRFPCIRAPTLVRAIIHDRHARMDCVHNDFGIGLVQTVMRGQIKVDGPDQIVGTYQVSFLPFGEITEVEEAKLSKSDQDAKRTSVLRSIDSRFELGGAKRVQLPGSWQWSADVL